MSLMTRKDWEKLRNEYHVAFSRMHPRLFKLLLDNVFGNPGGDSSSGDIDDTDAMMIYLARGEPPIQPSPPNQ